MLRFTGVIQYQIYIYTYLILKTNNIVCYIQSFITQFFNESCETSDKFNVRMRTSFTKKTIKVVNWRSSIMNDYYVCAYMCMILNGGFTYAAIAYGLENDRENGQFK